MTLFNLNWWPCQRRLLFATLFLVCSIDVEQHASSFVPARNRVERRATTLYGKRKNSGRAQQELAAKFQAAKRLKDQEAAKEQAATVEYGSNNNEKSIDNGPRCDEPISVNTGWRSGSGGRSKQQEKDEMIAEFETAVTNTDIKSSNCYSERTLPLDAFGGNEDLSGSKSVQYLKVGELTPLEVWNELVDSYGNPASFWPADGEKVKPLTICVTHYRQGSAKLKDAVETLSKKLPRKAFPADIRIVTRDTPSANRRLAKAFPLPGAQFYSAAGSDAWCWSHGITPQLLEFGVSVFVIDASTGMLFAVSYDCDPLEVVTFAKKAIAAYVDQHTQ